MKILDRLFGRKRKKRSYEASGVGRLLQNWTTAIKTPDEELRTSLRNLRARSRELSINNDYARKFFEMLKTNVIGANGIVLQSKAKRLDGTFQMKKILFPVQTFMKITKRGLRKTKLGYRLILMQRVLVDQSCESGDQKIKR